MADKRTAVTTEVIVEIGAIVAGLCSWDRNHSIFWAILHILFGWFYVVYFAMTR